MTTIGIILFYLIGAIYLYCAIFKVESFYSKVFTGFWVDMVGVAGCRISSFILGLSFVCLGFFFTYAFFSS